MGRLASSRDRHNGQRIDLVDAVPPCSERRIIRGPGHEHCPQVLHKQEKVIGIRGARLELQGFVPVVLQLWPTAAGNLKRS